MALLKKSKAELITELKKLQRKISSLEKKNKPEKYYSDSLSNDLKWHSFLKDSQNVVFVVDRKGIILDINTGTKHIKKKDIIGKNAFSFFANQDLKRIKSAIETVFKTQKTQEYTICWLDDQVTREFKTKAKAVVKSKMVVAVVLDTSETITEIETIKKNKRINALETKGKNIPPLNKKTRVKVLNNLNEPQLKEQTNAQIAEETNDFLEQEIANRKVIQLKLQESQKYTRLIINGSLDMICASDKQGIITEFNRAAQKTFGYSSEEVIGKHVSMLYQDPKERKKITDDELYNKGVYAGEVTNRKKNGENFISYLSASVLKNDEGEVIGAMGVSRDISELKMAEEKLRAQSAKFNAIIETSSHLIWTVDKNICLTTFNQNLDKELESLFGKNAKIGLSMIMETSEKRSADNDFLIKKYERAFAGEPQYFDMHFIDENGLGNWRETYLNPIFGEDGSVLEVSGISHDITKKKISEEHIRLSLQEKEVLLKEVHHRVKNNLQVISSILNLQSSYIKDEGTLQILKESQNRIKSMAFIHESLYQTKDFSSINFTEYVINLSQNLIHSYSNFDHEIKLNLDIQNVFLNLDLAIPCGLIINEIVSNALKYAFVDNSRGGEITIIMKISGENLILNIGDNGKGLPTNIDYRNTESLGLQLVITLTDQLSGTIELDFKKGTNYTIIFKQNQVKNRI
jgi:PAS domain S-box-containing protein